MGLNTLSQDETASICRIALLKDARLTCAGLDAFIRIAKKQLPFSVTATSMQESFSFLRPPDIQSDGASFVVEKSDAEAHAKLVQPIVARVHEGKANHYVLIERAGNSTFIFLRWNINLTYAVSCLVEQKVYLHDPCRLEASLVGPAMAPGVCALMDVGRPQTVLLSTPQQCTAADAGFMVLAWIGQRLLEPNVPLGSINYELRELRTHFVECIKSNFIKPFPVASPAVPSGVHDHQWVTYLREADMLTVRTRTVAMRLPPLDQSQVFALPAR